MCLRRGSTSLGTVVVKSVHWRLVTHFPSSLSEKLKCFRWHLKIFKFHYYIFMEDLWDTNTLRHCDSHSTVLLALNYCLDFLIKMKSSKVSCSPYTRADILANVWTKDISQTGFPITWSDSIALSKVKSLAIYFARHILESQRPAFTWNKHYVGRKCGIKPIIILSLCLG